MKLDLVTYRKALLIGWIVTTAYLPETWAAIITNVNVKDNFFEPANVRLTTGDRVRWLWVGAISHSSTSTTPGLWDSGLHGTGFLFTNTFNSAGTFAYHCTLHPLMTGSVVVQAPVNNPPSVSILSPTNGTVFAGPWTGTIHATAADSDGTVTKVQFYADSTLLGTVTNPPPNLSLGVTNLAPGAYGLKAVATDNLGSTNASSPVSISVLAPVPIVLSAPTRTGPSSFAFNYTATPDLRYIVRRSTSLPVWVAIQTNLATASPVPFSDGAAVTGAAFYSVILAPNP